ncbi:MAG: hypothetical protein H3C43_12875, partial [Leptonema sp. (in: Bacteria)]|nr:hypothetical protein [Leptonema sp. (in: bacteria)]
MIETKEFRWAIDGSLADLLEKRKQLSLSTARWQNLNIELVIIIDSGQTTAIEFLGQAILLRGLPIHILSLTDFQKSNSLSQFHEKRILVLHSGSNSEIKATIKANTEYDPVLDEPPFILESDDVAAQVELPQIQPNNVVQFPVKSNDTKPEKPAPKPISSPPSTIVTPSKKVHQTPPPKAKPIMPKITEPPTSNLTPITKISGWNIKVKTVFLISTLIVSALGAMIFWASREFTKDVEREIEANATYINSIVGQKVQVILEETRYSASLIASSKNNFGQFVNTNLFQDNQELIAIFVTTPVGNSLSIQNLLTNKEQMEANGIITDDLNHVITLYGDSLRAAATGATVALNASPGFRNPMVILSFPDQSKTGNVIVVLINAR